MAPAPSSQPNATDQTYASKVVTTSASPPQSTPPSPSPPPPNSTSPSPPPPVSPPPSSSSPRPPSPGPPPKDPPPPQFSPPPPAISTPPPAASPPPPSSSDTPTPPSKSSPQSDGTPPQKSPSPPPPKPPPPTETPPAPQGGAPPLSPSTQGTPPFYPPPGNQLGSIPPSSSNPLIPFPTSPGNPSAGVPPSLSTPAVPAPTAAPPQNSPHFGINKLEIVGIAVGVSFLLLSLVGLVLWYLAKQKKRVANSAGYVPPASYESSQTSDLFHGKRLSPAPLLGNDSSAEPGSSPSEPGGLGNSRSWFTYKELEEITNGFSPENLLGEGGFGAVYKGCLADGREVAVKQLKAGGGQGEREFRAEVETISRVHHRHLVSLVGYCISDHQRLLVYDYVPNNNLYEHLHDEGMPVMDWATRFRVAAGAARGIAYLHEDCHPRIIHRDIKSSNILLDNNFEARVSDFGLAKLALDAYTHITTRVMGTFGYLAPEYATSGKLTEKSDVYSFGVVLLELITGRKPVDASQPLGEESLVEWARPLLMHALDSLKFDELVDPRLDNNYVEAEMFRMIEAAAACVRQSAAKRPRMGQVMIALDSLGYVSDLRNGMTPGQSGVYDNAQESAEIRLFRRMAFGSQDFNTDIFSTKGSQS